MDTSRSRAPRRVTSEMPGNCTSSSRTPSAARCSVSRSTCGDETARVRAVTSPSTISISGSFAPGGGKLSMLSTAFSTFCSTSPPSDSAEYSTMTVARSAAAVPTTRSTPEIPSTASSTRRTISSSTSRTDDPGDTTVIPMRFKSSAGASRSTSLEPASRPTMAITAMSRLAATGLPAREAIGPALMAPPPTPPVAVCSALTV